MPRARRPATPAPPAPPLRIMPPEDSGGMLELIEALARIVADRCVDVAADDVLPSAPPPDAEHRKAA